MMNSADTPAPSPRFDYDGLDAETRAFVEQRSERIHNLARMTAAGIVQIGQYLTEVKEHLDHGRFLGWIEREFGWSQQSASRFMRVYGCFKLRNLSNLTIDVSALYLIAAPATPEPVRAEAVRRAGNGEAVTHAGARALVERFAQTGEIPQLEVSLPELIQQTRRQLPEIEPQETAEECSRREARREREANTLRVTKVIAVIESIERIAQSPLSMLEIAKEIDRWDTPDKDWHGQVQKAHLQLGQLSKEFQA